GSADAGRQALHAACRFQRRHQFRNGTQGGMVIPLWCCNAFFAHDMVIGIHDDTGDLATAEIYAQAVLHVATSTAPASRSAQSPCSFRSARSSARVTP